LLENGANSSFVALAADETVPVRTLLRRPADSISSADGARHPNIPLPRDLYRPQRTNSRGLEFGERAALNQLVSDIAAQKLPAVGSIADATAVQASAAIAAARNGFKDWSRTPAETRAHLLEKAADLLEQRAAHFIALLQHEGGKTLDDALSEVREAIDFCRYYGAQGRELFESNMLRLRGRGVFVAISPWNFPLAIFLGQVTAALMAGNAVVAKPAEQTPLIAAEAVRLLHEAGIPASALHLVQGDGRVGAALVSHANAAGVVFTGSTEVARSINRALAAKDGPIVSFRRPALLRAAAVVPAGRRRRPHDRDDRRRGARAEDR
jgi:RHH-type proline utilization regulon transcriptional repressor/proline dehydrogenase/delta 1-pyrroline-5-carboxylate dehydrogenase